MLMTLAIATAAISSEVLIGGAVATSFAVGIATTEFVERATGHLFNKHVKRPLEKQKQAEEYSDKIDQLIIKNSKIQFQASEEEEHLAIVQNFRNRYMFFGYGVETGVIVPRSTYNKVDAITGHRYEEFKSLLSKAQKGQECMDLAGLYMYNNTQVQLNDRYHIPSLLEMKMINALSLRVIGEVIFPDTETLNIGYINDLSIYDINSPNFDKSSSIVINLDYFDKMYNGTSFRPYANNKAVIEWLEDGNYWYSKEDVDLIKQHKNAQGKSLTAELNNIAINSNRSMSMDVVDKMSKKLKKLKHAHGNPEFDISFCKVNNYEDAYILEFSNKNTLRKLELAIVDGDAYGYPGDLLVLQPLDTSANQFAAYSFNKAIGSIYDQINLYLYGGSNGILEFDQDSILPFDGLRMTDNKPYSPITIVPNTVAVRRPMSFVPNPNMQNPFGLPNIVPANPSEISFTKSNDQHLKIKKSGGSKPNITKGKPEDPINREVANIDLHDDSEYEKVKKGYPSTGRPFRY